MPVKHITSASEFDADLKNAGAKLVVVDFFATWCGPCKRIAPFIDKLSTENTDVVFLKVDVDEVADLAGRLGISAMPTFHFYKNGTKVQELVGASQEKLQSLVASNK